MGDIRFSYNDDFNKTFLRPSQFVADRFLRCESMVFVVRKYGFCSVKVWYFVGGRGYLRGVRHVIGRPFAAVGADLSCTRIRKHTRNGGGNADLVMWKCVFSNGNMHFCLC